MLINHIYGQALNEFSVYRNETNVDKRGRSIQSKKHLGNILGTLSSTSQRERVMYQQFNHDASHKIVTQNITDIKAGDTLELVGGCSTDENRKFYVVDKRNPGSLDFWEVIAVNEMMSSD